MKSYQYPPETINLHFLSACEMRCKHCFAPFSDCDKIPLAETKRLIRAIAECPLSHPSAPLRRLNLVGGEPTLHPRFWDLVRYAREVRLRVSIVTNGFSFVSRGVPRDVALLDLVGVSIDSLVSATNHFIGRSVRTNTISEDQWFSVFRELAALNVDLKINTTVTKSNLNETMSEFICKASPIRWKVFQAFVVVGQNCGNADMWKVSHAEYETFIERHKKDGVSVCAEPESLMRGSYAMISPDGRFFDNHSGSHRYSDPILKIGIRDAWKQIHYDDDLFAERTQNYREEAQ